MNVIQLNSWRIRLIGYTCFLLTVFALAYLRLIPRKLHFFPYFDLVGHFVLYGIWGFLFIKNFKKPVPIVAGIHLPKRLLIILTIALLEECLQSFSPARSFNLLDFAWGALGIGTAYLITWLVSKKQPL